MSQRGQMLVVGLHALVAVTVLASATALALANKPISVELATLYGAIIGLAGGGSAAVSALGTAVNGKSIVSPLLLANLQETLRDTVDHLAGARKTIDDSTIAGGRRISDPPPPPPPPPESAPPPPPL